MSPRTSWFQMVLALPILLLPATLEATVYEVGDGLPYAHPGEVPWEALAPGDSVKIHHRDEDYRQKWVLCRRGTPEAPIVVQGIPSGSGELPVINGIDAETRDELDYWNENRGVIKIGGANQPPDLLPAHLVIENLDIRSARPPYTFTGRDGLGAYADNAAAIYVEKGEHLVIRGCTFRDSGNGFFCASETSDLLLQGNLILSNGIEGSIFQHNTYTEALGIVYEGNYFGPLRDGCPGNNLKDRSAGTVIRYNWIDGGNRQLDLVESDHAELYGDPAYRETFVYGNVLVEPDGGGNSQILHYGGDNGDATLYRKGTLYLVHNTVVSFRSGNTTLARLSTDDEHAAAWNNVVHVTAPGFRLAMLDDTGTLDLHANWLTEGWVDSHSGSAAVVDHGDNLTGSDPGFVDLGGFEGADLELTESSDCVDAGAVLPAEIDDQHPVLREYVDPALTRDRPQDGSPDIGAYEHAGLLDVIDPAPAAVVRAVPTPFAHSVSLTVPWDASVRIFSVDGREVAAWPGGDPTGTAENGVAGPTGPGADGVVTWTPGREVHAGIYFVLVNGTPAGRVTYLPRP